MINNRDADKNRFPIKIVLLLIVIVGIVVAYVLFQDYLNLDYLASIEADLKQFQADNHALTFLIAFGVYVAVTAFSLPFATVLSLCFAWFFGFGESLILISFASTTGATLAFLMSRYFFRDAVRKTFGDRFEKFNAAFESEGPFFLFTLRLIAIVPFFVINVIMALTTIKTRTFWWVSQLGMLPGTAAYCFLGSQFDSLSKIAKEGISINPWLLVAFAVLGIFPLAVRMAIKRIRPTSDMENLKNL